MPEHMVFGTAPCKEALSQWLSWRRKSTWASAAGTAWPCLSHGDRLGLLWSGDRRLQLDAHGGHWTRRRTPATASAQPRPCVFLHTPLSTDQQGESTPLFLCFICQFYTSYFSFLLLGYLPYTSLRHNHLPIQVMSASRQGQIVFVSRRHTLPPTHMDIHNFYGIHSCCHFMVVQVLQTADPIMQMR